MQMNLITISFSFIKNHQVIIGFTFRDYPDQYLYSAFEFDGNWSLYRYHLGSSENKFIEPETNLLKLFDNLLMNLQKAFPHKQMSFRKEEGVWEPRREIIHEINPSKIEMIAGYYDEAEKLKNILKISHFPV